MRLEDSFGPLPTFITLYPAVLLAASIGGGGPGILATVLSALAADYWFLPPYGSFSVEFLMTLWPWGSSSVSVFV